MNKEAVIAVYTILFGVIKTMEVKEITETVCVCSSWVDDNLFVGVSQQRAFQSFECDDQCVRYIHHAVAKYDYFSSKKH